MAEQTFTLEAGWFNKSGDLIFWDITGSSRPQFNSELAPGDDRYLAIIQFRDNGQFTVRIASSQSETSGALDDDLSVEFETSGIGGAPSAG